MRKQRKTLFAAAILAGVSGLFAAQRYGFGISKRTVILERRLLPDVQLGNVSLGIVFPRGTGGLNSSVFASDLETLLARGGGIRLVSRQPEYEIRCYTTALQPAHIVATTQSAPKWMGKAGSPTTQRTAHGNIQLDAQLVRAADGRVISAFTESVTLNASNSASGNAGGLTLHIPGMGHGQEQGQAIDPLPDTETDASLDNKMMGSLALHVASHLVLMDERITVLLAQGGELDGAARLALNGRWSEYLEQLSQIPPPPDAADKAYLEYDIGVANEALGYAASDPKAALKYLQESSIDYSKAVEANASEKYFLAPQRRIETAITRYTGLANAESAAAARSQQASHPVTTGEKLTNADVIKLVNAHLDKRLIANKIVTVPRVEFDLSVDGLVALSQAGVPTDLIALMTQRMQRQEAGHP